MFLAVVPCLRRRRQAATILFGSQPNDNTLLATATESRIKADRGRHARAPIVWPFWHDMSPHVPVGTLVFDEQARPSLDSPPPAASASLSPRVAACRNHTLAKPSQAPRDRRDGFR